MPSLYLSRNSGPWIRVNWLLTAYVSIFVAWASPIALGLHERWLSAGFEHGYPIFFLTCYLLYREFRRAPPGMESASLPALVVLMACVTLTLFAQAVGVIILPQLVLPVAIVAALWSVAGGNHGRRFALPLLFIYFAIPFWQIADFLPVSAPSLNEGLRTLTTSVVSAVVAATEISAFIDGNFIQVPYGTFEIAEGCSGRAFFIVGVELAVFYSLAFLRDWRHRLTLIAAVAAVSLVANWVRVFALIVIGYVTDMESHLIQSHSTFGWVVFMLFIAPMTVVANRLEEREEPEDGTVRKPSGDTGTIASVVPAAGALVLMAGFVAGLAVDRLYRSDVAPAAIRAPELDGWTRSEPRESGREPEFPGTAVKTLLRYGRPSGSVGVFLADFPVQRARHEAVNFANRLVGQDEASEYTGMVRVNTPAGLEQVYMSYRVTGNDAARLLWHAVRIAGRPALGPFHAKFLQLTGLIRGRTDAQVVVLTAACDPDCGRAEALLRDYAEIATEPLFSAADTTHR